MGNCFGWEPDAPGPSSGRTVPSSGGAAAVSSTPTASGPPQDDPVSRSALVMIDLKLEAFLATNLMMLEYLFTENIGFTSVVRLFPGNQKAKDGRGSDETSERCMIIKY